MASTGTLTGTLTQLYRAILRLHKQKLPAPMREMGNRYVAAEFRSHIEGKTTAEQWQLFSNEWLRYYRMLSGDGAADSNPDVLSQMTAEQQSKMAALYEEAQKLRLAMIDEAFDKSK